MSDPKQAAALAARFEPVMFFNPKESFFPINPKQYLEHCALWQVVQPQFDDKNNWGGPTGTLLREPQIAKGMIAALATELAGGKEWLGSSAAFGVRASDQQVPPTENFLEFVGWEPPVADPSREVTSSSNNSHAALQPPEYVTPLQDIRHWYYAEYLDNQDLRQIVDIPNIDPLIDLSTFLNNNFNNTVSAPQVLLYHLFYPLHQETLEGCENAGEGRLFGSYAGEWHCIALLLDSANSPQFIGLTSRNVGSSAIVGVEEPRVGMTVFKWSDAQTPQGEHPHIFVSLDTHGHYLTPGQHTLIPFTPGGIDPSRQSCGQVEKLDGAVSGELPGKPPDVPSDAVLITKVLGGMLAGLKGGLPGAVIGLVSGTAWALSESANSSFGSTPPGPTPPSDFAGDPGIEDLGNIIKPSSVTLNPGATPASVADWNVSPFATPDGRNYGFVVDRSQQLWWVPRPTPSPGSNNNPSVLNPVGFTGRWGPRVTSDPNNRRAGMKCPDFLLMFLEAVAIKLNV
jgi:hypothetical protein